MNGIYKDIKVFIYDNYNKLLFSIVIVNGLLYFFRTLMKQKFLTFFIIFLSLVALLPSSISASVKQDGWRVYPSFDKNIIKVIDTEKYVYFLVHSQLYYTTTDTHNVAMPVLFRKDKTKADSDIVALYDAVDANGTIVSLVQNTPDGSLVVIYDDLSIDIIHSDDSVVNVDALKTYSFPGQKSVYSTVVDLSGSYVWIATNFGYAKINVKNNTAEEIKNLNTSFTWVAPIGNKLIAFDGVTALEANIDKPITSISDFSTIVAPTTGISGNIAQNGALRNPEVLMPLSDNSFGFIARRSSGSGHSINTFTLQNGTWVYKLLKDDTLKEDPTTQIHINKWEGNAILNKAGYYIHSTTYAYQLTSAGLTSKKLDTAAHASSSWDFNTLWTYVTRMGFPSKTSSGEGESTTWTAVSAPKTPECSPAFIADNISYSPKYGYIFTNFGPSWYKKNFSTRVPVLLTGLKDGKFTNYSPAYNTISYVDENPSIANTYQFGTNADSYPIYRPKGVTIDPEHPNFVYVSSSLNGIARFNLDDLKAPILHLSRPNDEYATWPGFIPMAPLQSVSSLCCFSKVDFDADGNMFASYFNYDGIADEESYQIWFWKKENKEASKDANLNASLYKEWDHFNIRQPSSPSRFHVVTALKHPANRNLIVGAPSTYGGLPIVLDHKGTFDNKNDDIMALSQAVRDSNGNSLEIEYTYKYIEDPNTGNVWILHDNGCWYFNPNDYLNGSNIVYIPSVKMTSDAAIKSNLLESVAVYDMAVDDLDRYWFAANNGVWCVNSDLSEVLIHYSTDNSPMPSDITYSLCWNPDSQSLLISTERGLAEVTPAETGMSNDNSIRIYPNAVHPDYNAHVVISGVAESVSITDNSGTVIANLNPASNGKIYWDTLDSKNMKPKSGRYSVIGKNSKKNFGEIIVLK